MGSARMPRELRANTTIEVLTEPAPRYRPTDADEEVLETCRELQQYGQQQVTLVTADTAMRVHAASPERGSRSDATRLLPTA